MLCVHACVICYALLVMCFIVHVLYCSRVLSQKRVAPLEAGRRLALGEHAGRQRRREQQPLPGEDRITALSKHTMSYYIIV